MTYQELQEQNERLLKNNSDYGAENRHLRCVMLEAARHLDANQHPHLVRYLYSVSTHWVGPEKNPYPQNDATLTQQFEKYINTPEKP